MTLVILSRYLTISGFGYDTRTSWWGYDTRACDKYDIKVKLLSGASHELLNMVGTGI